MVYDRLLLTSSSFVDVVLFLLLLYWVWDGMASHGMVEVFVVAHICSSIECLHSVCAFIVFNRSSSYNIDMAWEINSTATKPTGSLCYVVVIAVLLFFFISQFEIGFAFNINRIFCKNAHLRWINMCTVCSMPA